MADFKVTPTVNGSSVLVGPLTDAAHGTRGGGGVHAEATSLAAGFMSAAQKILLDAVTSTPTAHGVVRALATGTIDEAWIPDVITRTKRLHRALTLGSGSFLPATSAADGSISLGDQSRSYTPTSNTWGLGQTTVLLSSGGGNPSYSTIGFHQAGVRIDMIRVGGGVIELGYNSGFGNALVRIPGGVIGQAKIGLAFASPWGDHGGTWEPGSYWKDVLGVVHLSGLVNCGSGTGASSTIATLPVGYRPASNEMFENAAASRSGQRIDVYPTGEIRANSGANAQWVSLSGITFRATP